MGLGLDWGLRLELALGPRADAGAGTKAGSEARPRADLSSPSPRDVRLRLPRLAWVKHRVRNPGWAQRRRTHRNLWVAAVAWLNTMPRKRITLSFKHCALQHRRAPTAPIRHDITPPILRADYCRLRARSSPRRSSRFFTCQFPGLRQERWEGGVLTCN